MLATAAARKSGKTQSAMRPFACPTRARMNENSPTWANARPTPTDARRMPPISQAVTPASIALTRITPITATVTRRGCWTRKPVSSSMPTDTKKKLVNTSRRGMMFPSACRPYSDSEMMSPARNAPRASDKPAVAVSQATLRQTAITASRNTSRLRVRATRCSSRGTAQRAARTATAMMPTPLARRRAIAPMPPAWLADSSGATSIMGTAMMSWKIRMPRIIRPWGVSTSARSCISFRTTAVLLSDTSQPMNTASPQGRPRPTARAPATAAVSPTWSVPPSRT